MEDFQVTGTFPAVISHPNPSLGFDEFIGKLRHHQYTLKQLLLTQGALLFRGFPITHAALFSTTIEALQLGNFVNYIGGDSPRDKIAHQVYTSTEAPPSLHIPLHQELSFMKKFPRHIYFFCERAPDHGGETIIGDARTIYRVIHPDVLQRFQSQALTYTSHYYHQSKIMSWVNRLQRSHKSWTEVFETHDKQEVEKKCLAHEFTWRWLKRDWLKIQQSRPATLQHPDTQESVWFNQAHLYDFNPKLLGWKRYWGAKLFYCRPSTRLHDISFQDGSKIPRRDLYHILDVLQANTVAFPWQTGDVMVLDNILTMHGRAPFTGKRRVLTALTV